MSPLRSDSITTWKLALAKAQEEVRAQRAARVGNATKQPTKTGARIRDRSTRIKPTPVPWAKDPCHMFHREIRIQSENCLINGINGVSYSVTPPVEIITIAVISDGVLWLRKSHSSAGFADGREWSSADNVSAGRINQEIRQVSSYLSKGEIKQESAEILLDWLYSLLQWKL